MNINNRIPLSSINQVAMTPIVGGGRRKPRLTYSSVIHSLVEQLTQRSPYLLEDHHECERTDIALLYRNEVQTGELLGQGNFSNVFAVSDIRLRRLPSAARSGNSLLLVRDAQGTWKPHVERHYGRRQESSDLRASFDAATTSSAENADKSLSIPEQRRLQLRDSITRGDGSCAYAVKCLKPELLEEASPKVFLEAATDLVIEAKYLSRFNHENILKVRGLAQGWEAAFANGEYDSFFILVDRLEETLNKRIKRWRHGEFPEENTIARKLPLAQQLASALSYLADRQLLFRDCKPQNIGLHRNPDDSMSVKLFDFGFCRQLPVVEQARDDVEDTSLMPKIATLPSGEMVYMMSGKGTRRYMAPEVLLKNRYNLKADVYSWAMVCWELLTLHKPFYKYTKDQHTLLVCEGGERPPLESSVSPLWPSTSFHSISASLSSMPSYNSDDEDSIDFPQVMTDPIRDLLKRAWHQDVSHRLSMRQVLHALDEIIESHHNNDATAAAAASSSSTPQQSRSDLSNASRPARGYSCLSAEYGDVRDIVFAFASDLPDLPFLACFGGLDNSTKNNHHPKNVDNPETTTTTTTTTKAILPKSTEISTTIDSSQRRQQAAIETELISKVDEEPEKENNNNNNSESMPYRFPVPLLQTLIVQ